MRFEVISEIRTAFIGSEKIFQLLFKPSGVRQDIFQVIGVLGAVGSIVVFYNAIYTWTSKQYQIWGKLQATIFALACLGVLWLVFAGHLLSFNSNY